MSSCNVLRRLQRSCKIRAFSLNSALEIFNRPDKIHAVFSLLATIVSLIVLCWVLAHWTWVWFSPTPELRMPALSAPSGQSDTAKNLFGQIQQHSVTIMGGTIQVLGVIAAEKDKTGYALLGFTGQPVRIVKEGAEISSGIRLTAVRPGEIEVERGGATETILLPKKSSPAPVTAAPR